MAWPTPQEYNEAIQNPRTAFSDPELRAGAPVLNMLGLPRPITGAFASVYQVNCPNQRTYAVRCFLREFGDQQERYAAISAHLAQVRLPYMANFTYLDNGIRVSGRWYPILKMEWLEGDSLNAFIERNLRDPILLLTLAEQWVQMAKALRASSIGHGDLQHGNVIISAGQVRLIDYDGMYVPALAGRQSHEMGHRNYQHPQRSEREFTLGVDNFSTWVVYTSLVALSVDPNLWKTLSGGDECLLFRREDFERPSTSPAFRALSTSPDARLRSLAAVFQTLCLAPLNAVPPIDGALPEIALAGAPARAMPAGAAAAPSTPVVPTASSASAGASGGAYGDWFRDHLRPPRQGTRAVPAGGSGPASGPGPARGPASTVAAGAAAYGASNGMNGAGAQLESPQPEAGAEARAEAAAESTAATEPSWIRDFLGPQNIAQAEFGDLTPPRTALAGAALAIAIAWLAPSVLAATVSLPVTVPALVTAFVVIVCTSSLARSYWSDPSVLAQRSERRQAALINRRLRVVHRQLAHVVRRQARLEHTYTRRREQFEARERQNRDQEKTALQRAEAKLKYDLDLVQRKRDRLQKQEADAVRQLEARHAQRLAQIDKQIADLRTQEELEIRQTLQRRVDQFVVNHLKRQTIEAAVIPNIGKGVKDALRARGIVFATDVEAARLAQVPGIGDARAATLLDWRKRTEALARQTAPTSLPKMEETWIRTRFYQRRFSLEQEKGRAQRKLTKEIADARARFAAALQATDGEPAKLRDEHSRRQDALRKQYKEQRTQLKRQLGELDAEQIAARSALEQEAAPFEAEIARLTAQRAGLEWRMRRFENIDLSRYLRRVLMLS